MEDPRIYGKFLPAAAALLASAPIVAEETVPVLAEYRAEHQGNRKARRKAAALARIAARTNGAKLRQLRREGK